MPKLYSSREVTKALKRARFLDVSQKGSHLKLVSKPKRLVVIIPANKKEIPMGTFHSVLRQSKLSKEDFE